MIEIVREVPPPPRTHEYTEPLSPPFPWHGGKRRVAELVWSRFGQVANYIEPFFGSGAVLLGRPGGAGKVETVNDLDCFVSNFWRALAAAGVIGSTGVVTAAGQRVLEKLVTLIDWPVNEADLHARHRWLVGQKRFRRWMRRYPSYFNTRIAAWWVWGICQWIGTGWCSKPEWESRPSRGLGAGLKIEEKRPHLSRPGRGVLKQSLPMVGAPDRGILGNMGRRGLAQKRPATGSSGRGVHALYSRTIEVLAALAERLQHVRICCGDWTRVLGRSTLGIDSQHGMTPTGVFLDPPYQWKGRETRLYAEDDPGLSTAVRTWALEHGDHPELRIALCGYEGEHDMPPTWTCIAWKSQGGSKKAALERIWFSPHCLKPRAQGTGQLALAL